MRLPPWFKVAVLVSAAVAPATSACGGDGTAPETSNEAPAASFEYSPGSPLAGEAVFFESTASDPDGTVVTHAWDFGGDITGTGATVTHAFESSGAHTVTLTVTDDGGATDLSTDVVDVNPAPSLVEITGSWHGGLTDTGDPTGRKEALVSVQVNTSMAPDRTIASVKYWHAFPRAFCEGSWRVVNAENGLLEVEDRLTTDAEECPDDVVRLEHDEEAQELFYTRATSGWSGRLNRAESISFAPIAGEWSGIGMEFNIEFWIEARLDSLGVRGDAIGRVEYGTTNPADHCVGDWIALDAQENVFRLIERILSGPCPHGTVTLEYDAETETLSYDFVDDNDGSANATGSLTKG